MHRGREDVPRLPQAAPLLGSSLRMSCRYSRALWNSSRFLSMRLMALIAGTELGLARSADWYACAASSGLLSTSAKLPAPKGQKPERRKTFDESIGRPRTNLHPDSLCQGQDLSRRSPPVAGERRLGWPGRRGRSVRAAMLHLHHGRRGMVVRHGREASWCRDAVSREQLALRAVAVSGARDSGENWPATVAKIKRVSRGDADEMGGDGGEVLGWDGKIRHGRAADLEELAVTRKLARFAAAAASQGSAGCKVQTEPGDDKESGGNNKIRMGRIETGDGALTRVAVRVGSGGEEVTMAASLDGGAGVGVGGGRREERSWGRRRDGQDGTK